MSDMNTATKDTRKIDMVGEAMLSVGTATVSTQWVIVTPDDAQTMLDSNECNRSIRWPKVDELTEAMSAMAFHLTHQGIAFYDDDTLADGQHRLHAIIKSGQSVILLVTYGIPRESVHAIDMGLKRSIADGYKTDGGQTWVTNSVASCITLLLVSQGFNNVARTHVHSYIRDHGSLVHDVFTNIIDNASLKLGAGPFAAAVVAAMYDGFDRSQMRRFVEVFGSGAIPCQNEGAALRARDLALSNKGAASTTRPGRLDMFRKYTRLLHAFANGENIKIVRPLAAPMFAPPPA